MRYEKNFVKEIYIATKRDVVEDEKGNLVPTYDEPIKYIFNVQPMNGALDMESYGLKCLQMQRAIIDYDKYFGVFKEDDVAYLDGLSPEGESSNGINANYRITAVLNQNKKIALIFERRLGK